MILSDVSVKRPVFATVVNALLLIFGFVAFNMLALREYPDIDPPIVSINTNYPGASATIVESRITQLIEDRISGTQVRVTLEPPSNSLQPPVWSREYASLSCFQVFHQPFVRHFCRLAH